MEDLVKHLEFDNGGVDVFVSITGERRRGHKTWKARVTKEEDVERLVKRVGQTFNIQEVFPTLSGNCWVVDVGMDDNYQTFIELQGDGPLTQDGKPVL
jgi:hypothetical protein